MLTAEENDRLTQVGPETPMGNLFRRYWQPIATSLPARREPGETSTPIRRSP